jgi:hypothetical protein
MGASPAPQRNARAAPDEMTEARRGLTRRRGCGAEGGKDPRPLVGIAYAKRGLVRIGRKDGKSAVLRPELRTKGPASVAWNSSRIHGEFSAA